MDTLSQEFRYALRKLVRNPGFTAVAVIALALGIGANTSIFSVVNAVLIRSLPFDDADRLVVLWENNQEQGRERDPVSPQNYLDWRDQSDAFEALAAWAYWSFTLAGADQPERVFTIRTSPSLFALLGAEAALGRTFTAEENELGGPNAVVLSHGLWERRFGSEPGVIGST
ncbi:MAG: ABC transporter permease, partial [Gemmatimonadota bacterium]